MLTVYTKDFCPFCDMAKRQLKQMNISYEEININKDEKAREFLIAEGHRSMPQIYHNGKLFVEGGAQGLAKMAEDTIRVRIGGVDLDDFQL